MAVVVAPPTGKKLLGLALASLGIVYGDIGTSPLYALSQTFFGTYRLERTPVNVLGACSLVFWALAIIVSLKYVLLILRADQSGEGGIFALYSLLRGQQQTRPLAPRLYLAITLLILFGAALLFGDGMITPAISVLSAYEGLAIATSKLQPTVVPLTVVTLVGLFAIQSKGTGAVGRAFGPIMVVWFGTIALIAVPWIAENPSVLAAVSPLYALRFLGHHGWHSMLVLGAVVLCITGGEALFADLGHFGRRVIRVSWFSLVYPCLLINYFGQGARLLAPAAIPNEHVFYALVPASGVYLYPLVALSTLATIIASQALISGVFSLARQAMALGYFPRLRVVYTSAEIMGQVYLPGINWILCAGCVALVVLFRTSNALGAAYGIAVTGTMAITTLAYYFVARGWGWPWFLIGPVCAGLIGIDLTFFVSNSLKFFDGGFIPLLIAAGLYACMRIWRWGRTVIAVAYREFSSVPMAELIDIKQRLSDRPDLRLPYGQREIVQFERAIVFLTSQAIRAPSDPCPVGLRIYFLRNGAFPKHVILFNVEQTGEPLVPVEARWSVVRFGANIVSVLVRYGYMENPSIPDILRDLKGRALIKIHAQRWTVQIGEEEIIIEPETTGLARIAVQLFRTMLRFTTPADRYFGLLEFPGRAKLVVPIAVGPKGAKVMLSDADE